MTTCWQRAVRSVYRKRLLICMCASFPFGSEGEMWCLIAFVPDHCFSYYFIENHIQKSAFAAMHGPQSLVRFGD